MELNPNHPTTQAARDQWHKICALVMYKLGVTYIEISSEDINAFTSSASNNIIVRDTGKKLIVGLANDADAAKLAKESGGLPF